MTYTVVNLNSNNPKEIKVHYSQIKPFYEVPTYLKHIIPAQTPEVETDEDNLCPAKSISYGHGYCRLLDSDPDISDDLVDIPVEYAKINRNAKIYKKSKRIAKEKKKLECKRKSRQKKKTKINDNHSIT